MATSNQIEIRKSRETERSNRERERETHRSNKEQERIGRDKAKSQGLGAVAKGLIAGAKLANDPSWYNLDKQLVEDTANVSFDTPLGYPVKNILGSGLVADQNQYTHPGILIIKWFPTIGGKSQVGDISAIASKNIYAFVRHANSGSRNYEASDLMMYLYAIDQAYSYHAFMRRIYSLALTSKGANRYYVNAMLESLGINPDSIRDNLASFRAYINSYATRVNSFYAPKDLSLFKRHYWLNTGIFKDSEIRKSQEYMFVQDSFGVYDDINGIIEFTPDQFGPQVSTKHSFNSLTNIGNAIINGLINSEDAGIMSGDILKAYGNGNMLFLEHTEENFHIESIFSLEVLSQITNATLMGQPISGYNIKQRNNNNKLISEIYQGDYLTQQNAAQNIDDYGSSTMPSSNKFGILCQVGQYLAGESPLGFLVPNDGFAHSIINMYKDNPNCDDIMVATRLTVLPERVPSTTLDPHACYRANAIVAANSSTKWGTPLQYYGTEVCTEAYIITLDPSALSTSIIKFKTINSRFDNSFDAGTLALVDRITKFDWAPIIYMAGYIHEQSKGNYELTKFISSSYDGANYASVVNTSLGNMHYVATMSELGIPLLGTTVRTR